jgi:hypothetical protein
MTSVSWPVILSGDYSDGSICNAADYKNDFYLLRDAVNQLYERFGSYRINARAKQYFGNEVSGSVAGPWMNVGIGDYMRAGFAQTGNALDSDAEKRRRLVRTMIQIPSWMQGVRIRGIQALNLSQISYHADMEFRYLYMPPTVGVSVGSAIDKFDWQDADVAFNTGSGATDVEQISFGNRDGTGSDSGEALNDAVAFAGGAGESYTEVNAIAGPNYSPAATGVEYRPVMQAKTADYVVSPGEFIGLWIAGAVYLQNNSGGSLSGPYFLEYSWDVLMDAMIPIP